MFRYILYALLIWFVYKLIVGLIIPIYKTTKQVKKQFREMHEQMQEKVRQQQDRTPPPKPQEPAPKGDYLDFEEVE